MIVGLGNPGAEYQTSRHNAGFMAVDRLADRLAAGDWKTKFTAQIAEYRGGAATALLVKPQTFMNLSGEAVGAIARWYKIAPEEIVVVYDDMDLPAGALRLRKQGGSGGHRGVESVLLHLGSERFARVRIGVGRPPAGWKVVAHVLSGFAPEEEAAMREAVAAAAAALECVLRDGFDKAMNRYNRPAPAKDGQEPSAEAQEGGS